MRNAIDGGTDDNAKVTTNFRARVASNTADLLKYGAAYFPYVSTNVRVPHLRRPGHADVVQYDHRCRRRHRGDRTPSPGRRCQELNDAALNLKGKDTAVYAAIQAFLTRPM